MNLSVVLNCHENSPVFRDTLDSIIHHWTDRVLVVADAKNWVQFRDEVIPASKVEGLYHGRPLAPFRNVCLGLMKAWETWGTDSEWYCYMEYDCLVGSPKTIKHLADADDQGLWIVGNDHRVDSRRIPFFEKVESSVKELHYLLGCCVFMSRDFLAELARRDFFERFLVLTNFVQEKFFLVSPDGAEEAVYDIGEFLYPTLAVHYGGRVGELACWEGSRWRGDGICYPMRFRPDLHGSMHEGACVMHPLKDFDSETRKFHRNMRSLTGGRGCANMPTYGRQ